MHSILTPMILLIFKSGLFLISHAINRLVLFHQIDFLKLVFDSLQFISQIKGFIGDIVIYSLLYDWKLEPLASKPFGTFFSVSLLLHSYATFLFILERSSDKTFLM